MEAKEKLKTIAARSVEAFQMTDKYNTVLFNWYFKGFELLRRYLIKHPFGVDLETLDLEEVDQEMIANEAVQPLPLRLVPSRIPLLVTPLLETMLLLTHEPDTLLNFFFFFLGACHVLGFL